MQIHFLTVDDVIVDQERQLELYGGGLPGILNPDRLESAVAMPQASFGGVFVHQDLFEMASAYLFYLVSGHAFGNGNKRIGLDAALVFLHVNGVVVEASCEALTELVLGVCNHCTTKDDVCQFFRLHDATASGAHVCTDKTLACARGWIHHNFGAAFAKLAE